MAELFTFGETMAAFAPDREGPLRYAGNFQPYAAGSESNVAVGAAKLGVDTEWFSRLGMDEFGYFIRGKLRAEGVKCGRLIFDREHPTGIMFKGIAGGETKVFYYRKDSAASTMCPSDLDRLDLEGVRIVYLTGITPVLSESCRKTVEAMFDLAERRNITVAFDPNIRKKLWHGKDHTEMLRRFTLRSGIVLTGLDEGREIFGVQTVEEIVQTVFQKGRAEYLVIKDGARGAVVSDGSQTIKIPPYPCTPIETIGAGDGFNAGFLSGIIKGADLEKAAIIGSICGAMATQTRGDYEGYPDAEEMRTALEGRREPAR